MMMRRPTIIMAMTKLELVFVVLFVSIFLQRITQAQDEKDEERSKCNSNAMVLAMSACQASRHKLSLASHSNDTAKLCGALQRYSYCMAPRLEGCKGATRMAFDVIRTKYATHYNCHIVTQHGGPAIDYDRSGSPLLQRKTTGSNNNDYFTPQQPYVQNASPGNYYYNNNNFNNDYNNNNNNDNKNNTRMTGQGGDGVVTKTTTQPVKISNAVGVEPTMSTITNNNNNTTTSNTTTTTTTIVITSSNSNNTTPPTKDFNTTLVNRKTQHLPDSNTTPPLPYSNNITLIIFDPADANGSTCFHCWTQFTVIIIILSAYCSSLLL